MNEKSWLVSDDPVFLIDFLTQADNRIDNGWRIDGFVLTDRKLRLWCSALHYATYQCLSAGRYRAHWYEGRADKDEDVYMPQLLSTIWAKPSGMAQQDKADILRDIVGNPYSAIERKHVHPSGGHVYSRNRNPGLGGHVLTIDDAWLTPTVVSLANSAYDTLTNNTAEIVTLEKDIVRRQFNMSRLGEEDALYCVHQQQCAELQRELKRLKNVPPGSLDSATLRVLSDALEEAGCTDPRILMVLRGWQPCQTCDGTGQQECDVDAGYGNPAMTRRGTRCCYVCNAAGCGIAPGWCAPRQPINRYRGFWVLDVLLNKEAGL